MRLFMSGLFRITLSLLLIFSPQLMIPFAWLPQAIRDSQSSLAENKPTAVKKVDLAVLDLKPQGDVTPDNAQIISDRVRAELFRTGRYRIIERSEMQAIIKEQGFQQTQDNCEVTDCSVALGKILAVRQIVVGSVSQLGEIYTLSLRIIDVEKGTILKEGYRDCRCDLEEVLTRLTSEMALELTQDGSQSASQSDPRLLSALPLKDRQAYFNSHSQNPWIASALNGFLPLPFGYIYSNNLDMFWTMALLEAGVVGSSVAFQVANPRNPFNNTLFNAGLLLYVGLAGFTVVDVWFRADKNNQNLRHQLRLEQALRPGPDLARLETDLPGTVPIYQYKF